MGEPGVGVEQDVKPVQQFLSGHHRPRRAPL